VPEIDLQPDPIAAFAQMKLRTPKAALKERLHDFMDETYAGLGVFDYKKAGLVQFARLLHADLLVRGNTSGTTGRPLEFYRSPQTIIQMFFSMLEALRSLGWQEGDAILSAWQAINPARVSAVRLGLRALGFPLFTFTQIDDATCRAFLERLDREAPAVVFGFPGYYLEFARFRMRTGYPLRHPPRFILCGGEVLLDQHRALLEEAFATRVYNSYGGNEFGFVAVECRHRRGLHVIEHAFVAETGDDDHLLLTTLAQPEMPLIKYETGDHVVLTRERCPCGVSGTKILHLEGRTEDYLLNASGNRVFSRYFREALLDTNRRFANAIVRGQFVQNRDGDLRFLLEMIDGSTRAEIARDLQERLRHDLHVPVSGSCVERLLPAEGKFKFLVREA
jgi:phenylacetate-coenzyme A ligase PaaK-like adenylate-forming protein